MRRLPALCCAVLLAVPVALPAAEGGSGRQLEPGGEAPVATLPDPEAARRLDRRSKLITLLLLGGAIAVLATEDVETIEEIGDVLQLGLPVTALGATFLYDDASGRRSFLKSVATSTITVAALKEIVDKARPNAQGLNSFPSGHTAAAFSGASFLNLRYGPRWGAPSLVLAAYTGASRIRAQKHFLDDVISGLSISVLANRYFTFPIDADIALLPVVSADTTGFMARWRGAGREWRERATDPAMLPRRGLRYEWEFGGTAVDRNDLAAPAVDDGFSLLLDESNNPTVTARIEFAYTPRERQEIVFQLAPFEVRETGMFDGERRLGDIVVPGGEPLAPRFLLYDYRLRYRFLMRPAGRVRLHSGVGVSFQDIVATLDWQEDGARIEEGNFIPFAHLDAEFPVSERVRLSIEIDGGRSGDDRLRDAAMGVRWQVHPRWDLSGGVRRIERTVVTDLLRNRLERDQAVIAFGYSF